MMGRVFLPHRTDKDVTSARDFGEIIYLCDDCQVFDVDGTLRTFNKALNTYGFDPLEDYICMTGRPLALAFLLALVVRQHERVRLLFHNAKFNAYRARMFTVEDLCTTTSKD